MAVLVQVLYLMTRLPLKAIDQPNTMLNTPFQLHYKIISLFYIPCLITLQTQAFSQSPQSIYCNINYIRDKSRSSFFYKNPYLSNLEQDNLSNKASKNSMVISDFHSGIPEHGPGMFYATLYYWPIKSYKIV